MKTTLKDIAEYVGVTPQLVSFYLNHPETTRVAKETRGRIDEAVKRLDYHPNSVARALCTGRTKTIGLVMGGLTERKRGCYIHALMNEAKKYGYYLLTAITNYDQKEEQEILEYMMGRQVDGILYTLYLSPGARICQRLHKTGFPILLHAPQANQDFNTIDYDCTRAVEDALRAFLERGAREILYLGAPNDGEYRNLCELRGKEPFSLLFRPLPPEPGSFELAVAEVLKKRPSAIFTVNVIFLQELLDRINESAPEYRPACVTVYSVPFDWIRNDRVIGVVHRFYRECVESEIRRMLEIIEHPEEPPQKLVLPTEYVSAEQLEAIRMQQLNDPYYKQFK